MIRRPPFRADPWTPDPSDGDRLRYVADLVESQTPALLARDRTIEENIRMIAGQQWHIYSERLGRFIDTSAWGLTEDEKIWRQRPVLNRLVTWFLTTVARMTENPPIIGWLPGPDRIDAELAEILDTVMKVQWRQAGMTDAIDQLASWLIPCGQAHMYSRIDPNGGELVPWIGRGQVPIQVPVGGDQEEAWEHLTDPMTGQPLMADRDDVPFTADGQPASRLTLQGWQSIPGLEAHASRAGIVVADVLSPLQVRGEWGHHIPWHMKRWHSRDIFLRPEEVAEYFHVELPPDTQGAGGDALDRVLFGPGYWGSASATTQRPDGLRTGGAAGQLKDGYVKVRELWERPSSGMPGMQETPTNPGGRLLVVAPLQGKVLRDGPRPLPFRYVSPIRSFEFVRLPGRPGGTSPVEFMVSPQRSENRLTSQVLEHTAVSASPKKVIARGSGLENVTISNRPDENLVVTVRPGVKPIEYVAPPPLSGDVWKAKDHLTEYLASVGSSQPVPGEVQGTDPSAKLVRELRFDRDRFLGPTLRRMTEEFGRMQEDWLVYDKVLFTAERLLTYAGDDNIARTVLVRPELFLQGNVNAQPAPESMLPESRGERIARARTLYQDGVWGPPGSPQAAEMYLEQANFPSLSRMTRPGGPNRVLADHMIGKLVQGQSAQSLSLFEWYDLGVIRAQLERFMTLPDFLALDRQVQEQFAQFRSMVLENQQLQQARAMAEAPPPPPSDQAPRSTDEPAAQETPA